MQHIKKNAPALRCLKIINLSNSDILKLMLDVQLINWIKILKRRTLKNKRITKMIVCLGCRN